MTQGMKMRYRYKYQHNNTKIAFLAVIVLLLCITPLVHKICIGQEHGKPISTDSRIKTLIYSENDIFPLILHYGYQTAIEFAVGEVIQTYSAGHNYAFQFTPNGRTLFIKPFEEYIETNLLIITNKHRYYFDLKSRMVSENVLDEEFAYVIRFFYPEEVENFVSPGIITAEEPISPTIDSATLVRPYNFNYTISGPTKIAPIVVFDDGINTFFKFDSLPNASLTIISMTEQGDMQFIPRKVGNYLVVNALKTQFTLKVGEQKVEVHTVTRENKSK